MARKTKPLATRIPITPTEFKELKEICRKLRREARPSKLKSKPALPFVPYCGPEYGREKGAPRIMYVGKATRGRFFKRDKLSLEDCSIETQIEAAEACVDTVQSEFWRFGTKLVQRAWRAAGLRSESSREWAMDRIVWSNLFKVGLETGNPTDGFGMYPQREIAQRLILREINVYRPTAIVLVCGENGGYFKFIEDIFGKASAWSKIKIKKGVDVDCELWMRTYGKARMYWTRHPERWHSEPRDLALKKIAADQGRFVRAPSS